MHYCFEENTGLFILITQRPEKLLSTLDRDVRYPIHTPE